MVSWNNKQAPGWAAADDQYGYGPDLPPADDRRTASATTSPAREDVAAAARPVDGGAGDPDIRAVKLLPILFRALGHPSDPEARGRDRRRFASGSRPVGHRRDLEQGRSRRVHAGDHADGRLVAAPASPPSSSRTSASKLYRADTGDDRSGRPGRRAPSEYPSFARGLVRLCLQGPARRLRPARRPPPYSRDYCGGGSKAKCRRALRASLLDAAKVTPADGIRVRRLLRRPEPRVLGPGPRDAYLRDLDPGDDLPEPADVPADGLGHAQHQVARVGSAAGAPRRPARDLARDRLLGDASRSRSATTSCSRRRATSRPRPRRTGRSFPSIWP